MNRTFPRHPRDSARHPLSAALLRVARKLRTSWYIDLHEANGLSNVNPNVLGQTLIVNPNSKAVTTANRIASRTNRSIAETSLHFTVRLKPLAGSGRNAAYRLLRAKAITVETCWNLPLPVRVRYQANILHHILKEAGMIGDEGPIIRMQQRR